MIPEDKIVEIRNTSDIVEIISEMVLLKRAGKDYKGLCPFHSEKTPSFVVSPEKQIFHCFGCGVGGDVFSFLMKYEGLSFPQAVKAIAIHYGIEIPTQDMSPEQTREINEREKLFDINHQAMEFFHHTLMNHHAGKKAVAYLTKRHFSREVIETFKIGYDPGNFAAHCFQKNISHLAEKAGLIASKNGRYYDRFWERITFPIFDIRTRVAGFGGRVLDDAAPQRPKYINSPETPIYNKRRYLYGLHKAKYKCRETRSIYIVEGYLDLLSLHQHGIENAAAVLGTALTMEHIQVVKGFAKQLILVFDSDQAGVAAAQRSAELFWKKEIDAHILVLQPAGYDPDSYLLEFGTQAFIKAASQAPSVISFLLDSSIKTHGLSIEGKIHIISDMEKPLSAIQGNIAQSLYVKEVAERTGVDEIEILKKIKTKTSRISDSSYTIQKTRPRGKWYRFEEQIIAMMLQFPDILPDIQQRNILQYFEDNILKAIGESVLAYPDKKVSEILALMQDEEKGRVAFSLAFKDDAWNLEGCLNVIKDFESRHKRTSSFIKWTERKISK